MRRVRYAVAASLDGYIAGPNGEADWIVMDPEIDFKAIWAQYDTLLIGRGTFETMAEMGGSGGMPGVKVVVCSRTLRQQDHPKVTIVPDAAPYAEQLRVQPGKDIWLFGGGLLFQSLLEAGQVDTVEVAIVPVLLGGGIPLLPSPAERSRLKLTGHRIYSNSGIVALEYDVLGRNA